MKFFYCQTCKENFSGGDMSIHDHYIRHIDECNKIINTTTNPHTKMTAQIDRANHEQSMKYWTLTFSKDWQDAMLIVNNFEYKYRVPKTLQTFIKADSSSTS